MAGEVMKHDPIIFTRKGRRIGVALNTRILYAGRKEAAGRIVDISFFGLRVETELQPERDDFVSVELPQFGLVRAKVAWCRGGSFGALFLKPVDIRTFMLDADRQLPNSSTPL